MTFVRTSSVFAVFAYFGICYGLPSQLTDEPPSWGDVYSVQGTLHLPYAEIVEPFSVWFDATNKRSRIDYYGDIQEYFPGQEIPEITTGMVMTFQRADQGQFGISYKVAPMSNYKVRNMMTCFKVSGFFEAPVDVQIGLPDLTGFVR